MNNNQAVILIFGAGGIGEAVALLLAEYGDPLPRIFIGDRYLEKAEQIVSTVQSSTTRSCRIDSFVFSGEKPGEEVISLLRQGDVLLDCLPGSLAPAMARLALDHGLHYANLTEYVAETNAIVSMADRAETGFLLQTGLAPGFVNVLANGLYRSFCNKHGVDKAERIEMRTGALTRHAGSPHFYGFTWSPVGVATEYVKDTVAVRDHEIVRLPSLSERESLIIDGRPYEADLTSGGSADIPMALGKQVANIDYKTIRYPGHYDWVKELMKDIPPGEDRIPSLLNKMIDEIPELEDDRVLVFVAVEGSDRKGRKKRMEQHFLIGPQLVGNYRLRAIQVTTAAPLAEAAYYLLKNQPKGTVFQSDLDPFQFLNGQFIKKVYGGLAI